MLSTSVTCDALIGRALYVETLDRAIARAAGGEGQIVLISGEAGIGKSRLVAETKARCAPAGWRTLEGRSFEPDSVLPFAPLVDLLRAHFGTRPPDDIARSLGTAAPLFARLLPELAAFVPAAAPALPAEPEQEKRLLFETLAQYLQRLAAAGPVLLVLEDLHWSDDTTLDFLLFFARRTAALPALLLLTYRSDEAPAPLRHLLAELDRQRLAAELVLPHLTIGQVDHMLQAIFDLHRPVRADFLETIYALTEGNPFFVEETLKSLVAAGDIFRTGDGWDRRPLGELHIPRSIQDAVQRRADALSAPARELLRVAAVAGQRADFAVLQRVTGHDEGALLGLIKELLGAQLMTEAAEDAFAFRHALTRQAVYTQLLARERKALHGTIAETIEQVYAASLDMHCANLADHFYAAGMWDKALQYARRAGERAQMLYAPQPAAEQFSRAITAAVNLSGRAPSALYRARGQARETLGDFAGARADYEAALEAAQAERDRMAEWQALLDLGLLWASRDYARTGEYYRQALALAREIEEPVTLAHTLNRVGNWRMNTGRPLEAMQYHHEARALFEIAQDRRGLAATLDLLGMCAVESGESRAVQYYEEALALFREQGDRYGQASVLSMIGLVREAFQEPAQAAHAGEQARAEADTAVRIAREIGWRSAESFALIQSSWLLGIQGRYGDALDNLQQALSIAQDIEHRQWTAAAHSALGVIYLNLLAVPRARHHLEQAYALAREIGSLIFTQETAGGLALAYVHQREFEIALDLLDTALTGPAETFYQRLCVLARARLELARGGTPAAMRLIDELYAGAPQKRLNEEGLLPEVITLAGEVLAAAGRTQAAEEALRVRLAEALARGQQAAQWRLHGALGRLYLSQKRQEAADGEFAAARHVIEALATQVPEDDLREDFRAGALATLPAHAPLSPRQAAKREYGGLTEREREIAALIAQGLSNREIAEACVLSERTVSTHVGNILAKLGFTSRTQIAAWAVEKALARQAAPPGA